MSKCSSLTCVRNALQLCFPLEKINLSDSGVVSIENFVQSNFQPCALRMINLSGCRSLVALTSKLDAIHGLEIIGADDVPRFDEDARIWKRLARRQCDCFECTRQFGLDAPRLKVCGRCGLATYCGVECQRAHWDWHREVHCAIIRSQRRRTCDVCHRRAKHDSPVFPVCDCGARRYCGEECQAKDWAAGHSETCASRDLY